MKKTKIAFEDIKAGDLIEVNKTEYGVKNQHTGIAFELERDFAAPGTDAWKTSEDGIISVSNNGETIYRIDVAEVKFEDVREGDLIRVTRTFPTGTEEVITGKAHFKQGDAEWWDGWADAGGKLMTLRISAKSNVIEILEREGE
jgi:hypothetical protein